MRGTGDSAAACGEVPLTLDEIKGYRFDLVNASMQRGAPNK
jgi:hypothetical protein